MEYKSFIGDMNTGDSSMELENGQSRKRKPTEEHS